MSDQEQQVRRLARVLSGISHALESGDERHQRIERALELAREVVPCVSSAVLEIHDEAATIYVSPALDGDQREALHAKLLRLYRLVTEGEEIGRAQGELPSLALPVMGLDRVIGVIRVEPSDTVYDARHLRLLSVISAQLGAYLTMVRLREQELARSRELEAAHDFQRLLAGVVGHDLRSPLTVITSVASTLLRSTTDPVQRRHLERALRNAEHASKLISDLVDVTESRVTGVIRVHPEPADFGAIARRTVDDLRQAYPARTIELVEPAVSLEGRCDPTRVAQLLTNLVVNAVVHGDAARPICVGLVVDADHVTLSVRNWGPAIPPALLATIFDPFKQGAPRSRPSTARGLGLGLYIVDCLARGHGGSVRVTSDQTAGTSFEVRLPLVAVERAAPATGDHALVLVVDDDEDVRESVMALLSDRGYDVVGAANGLEALRELRAGLRPRLVLLDYNMPVMDGEEFCQECARVPELAAIPIVLVSGNTGAAVKLAAARGAPLVSKPVSVAKLVAALESV